MRAVVQRVSEAAVRVDGAVAAQIGAGLVVLLGVGKGDADSDAQYLAEKVAHLRILDDDAGQMNRSVLDTAGQVLVVSQFTLYGDVRRGRRPGWSDAAPPEEARRLYEQFVVPPFAAWAFPSRPESSGRRCGWRSSTRGPSPCCSTADGSSDGGRDVGPA